MTVMPTVLTVLCEGFEELEAIAPIDLMRRAGIEVVSVALGEGIHVTGRSGITLHADRPWASVNSAEFDCLFLPGGPAVGKLRKDPRVRELVVQFASNQRLIAAICAAPLVLLDAGLLVGRRYTAHPSTAGELPESAGDRIVVDGTLITSRGAGTSLDLGIELVRTLVSEEKATEVARSIAA